MDCRVCCSLASDAPDTLGGWPQRGLILGSLLYFQGLALYLWGAKTLGAMYRASSGLGVQLDARHKLITHGPFRLMRHPLYLGL
jgi:protein-S-isoprenylcysteine O-methyltransferase Ste14